MNISKIKTPKDIFELTLGELYDGEKYVEKALGKLIKKVSSAELKSDLEQHYAETQEQIIRLEKIFELVDLKPRKLKSEGIRGIVSDSEDFLYADISGEVKDTLLAAGARKVESFEMSCYLTAGELANFMGLAEVEELLKESYREEEAAEKRLMEMGEKLIKVLFESENMAIPVEEE